ncbi:MAG: hypothetical protein EOO15_20215 [Chitinophagaceae bacterium]|nr:MAG: hypothetical protein EOO15_20215 [Chitinophagaceae bacterium]
MAITFPQRNLLIISACANAYFGLQVLLFQLHAKHVLVGVFTELLTIPAIIALLVSGAGLMILWIRGRMERRNRTAAFFLTVSTVALITLAFFV